PYTTLFRSDVRIDVVLRSAGGVVGRGLVAVDGAPGEQRAPLVQLARPLPCLGQQVGAEAQRVPRPARLRERQERDHVDLGVTEVESEEHTSELQSRFDLVCRLLLEKKKK